MGGTHSLSLSLQACHLWHWCLERDPSVSRAPPRSGKHSCRPGVPADRNLNGMEVAQGSFPLDTADLGQCQMDLFATRLNHQLDHYVSWRPDPFAQETDAFRLNWKSLNGYVFPPFCLKGRCLQKIQQEPSTIAMVVPQWHSQVWYPTLMECLVDCPLCLPKWMDLLQDPSSQPHPLVFQGSLKLLACRVSGNNMLQQAFQRKLQNCYWQDGVQGKT